MAPGPEGDLATVPSPADFAAAWPRALGERVALVAFDRVDSTQRRARRLLDRHLEEDERPRPYAVVAVEQSAGRGRQGRGWASGPGRGIWASLVAPLETGERGYASLVDRLRSLGAQVERVGS